MSVLLETYKAGDSDIHEYITVERLSVHTASAMPIWAAKQWSVSMTYGVNGIGCYSLLHSFVGHLILTVLTVSLAAAMHHATYAVSKKIAPFNVGFKASYI